ncbi:glycerophosphodiester phosphodiesterase family protein [Microscilla marina]|uniref:Glycerophosphoryl diester phosphodiesterase n=1 Tax=Microscilla marina ATCC 23134 TaxID=313606 RepID=A1ZS30_MICM2|nr:glycerophosphodiester phosphodiesterase family protein [Microscilla marina]EAY26753.1 glycerophosphoryl diester phosphodiesterase [Microscilla marina ATCC 23134]
MKLPQLNKTFNRLSIVIFVWLWVGTQAGQAQHYLKIKSVKQLYAFFERTPDRIPMVSAHRGGPSDGYPENCLATFQKVINAHPALIECDIRTTKDQQLVMMHDRTLDRTTNGTGRVNDHTLAQLKKLKLKDNQGNLTNFKIPTLKETLLWTKDKTVLTLDIKRGVNGKQLVDMIRETRTEASVVLIVYNLKDALKYHILHPKLMMSVSLRKPEDLNDLKKAGIPFQKLMAFVGVGKFKEDAQGDFSLKLRTDVIKAAHQQNLSCTVGTMYSIDKAGKHDATVYQTIIKKLGGDILATDAPQVAYDAIHSVAPAKSSKQRYYQKK